MLDSRKPAFFLTLAALLASSGATAQDGRGVVSGCYVPPTGLVYVVGAPGAPDDCLDQRHVSFSWPNVGHFATKPPGGGNGPPDGKGGGPPDGNGGGPPAGTGGAAPTVPSGMVMHFDLAACPGGWTEVAEGRGRTLVGLPEGGTLGGTVGDPLADLEDRAHDHTVPGAELSTASAGEHGHSFSGDLATAFAGNHNHQWSFMTAGKDWHTWQQDGETLRALLPWNNGIDSEGTGIFPLALGNVSSRVDLYTANNGQHAHEISADGLALAGVGGHEHTLAVPEQQVTPASTGDVMPYLQLLVCQKD